MLILTSLAVISIIPNSLADELIQTFTGNFSDSDPAVGDLAAETAADEQQVPELGPSPTSTDFAQEEIDPKASPTSTVEPTPKPSSTTKAPYALANQSMRIIAPSEVNVDPRARSVFLPSIYVESSGNLLICASSNLGSFDANLSRLSNYSALDEESSLEISGSNTPKLRISGLGSQAVTIINGVNGLRVFSSNRALAGSYVQLSFINLSEASVNPKLCNDASASNTRTIYLRALGIDLNITKGGITLK